ncbi:hypothetical protein J4212_04235 [Candidatus Woesearchaeota archaeon]|nr:hypothetical protein [Candidatus Woesearchaeota archaeon]
MAKVAALGSAEFIVGFQLAGIKDTFESGRDIMEKIKGIRQDKGISIVIVDENALMQLDEHDRMDIEESVMPVFLPLSINASQEGLRKMIIKSVGVDLWK